ncbi:MAG: TRAP transporter permease [Haloarculaceae archaeon]
MSADDDPDANDGDDEPGTNDGPGAGADDGRSDVPADVVAGDGEPGLSAGLSEEEAQELLQELEHKRSLAGWAAVLVSAVAVLFSAYQAWLAARGFVFELETPLGTVSFGSLQLLKVNAIHVTFALVLAFMLFPVTGREGFLSRRLGTVPRRVRRRVGADHPLARGTDRVAGGVRWAVGEGEGGRVTPVDGVLVGVALVACAYFVTDFAEIQNRIRVLGFSATRTVGEVYGFLAPVPGLSDVSYAYLLGVLGVLLVLEATRRALGFYLVVIVSSFVAYARYAYLIPGDVPYLNILATNELRWGSIVQNLWYNTENGVFGIPVTVSVQFIYIFILFGAFLEMSGAGQWFIDLAYPLTGSRTGGPAKASILSSGFMGTISGSSIANTVTTGAFTIPLMKRSGYRPEFAGAVEASASSGGQILPPVMGAAAFLIVEYTLTPYSEVIVAAAIPALVFFFGVWVMVDLEARRAGIGGVDAEALVSPVPHLKRGWFYLVPLALLLYYLIVARLSVARSAWFTIVAIGALIALVAAYDGRNVARLVGTIVAVVVAETVAFALTGVGIVGALTGAGTGGLPLGAAVAASTGKLGTVTFLVSMAFVLARPRADAPLLDYDAAVDDAVSDTARALDRPGLVGNGAYRFLVFVLKSMDSGARTATTVVVAVAAAGIIPGVISVTGLGPNLTAFLEAVSGGSLVLLLVITAFASIVLGMGMPTTVTYIILASMLAPAIAQVAAIPILAAHLFILYFGVIADITPPVAVAAYAASGVAKSDPFRTGVQAFSLSLNKAIVPFAFVLAPGILLIRGVGTGEQAGVLTLADVADVGWFLPNVLVPVVGLFVGVYALGPTIIGYLNRPVSRVERGLFAVAALLLMAPGLLFEPLFALLALVGVGAPASTTVLDVGLRAAGGVLFGMLYVRNSRPDEEEGERTTTAVTGD